MTETTSDLRQRILREAMHLMAEQGFTGTPMRQLAEVCDCNVAMIYRHFPSKESILDELVGQRRTRLFDGPPPVSRGASVEDTLTRFFTAMLDRDVEYECIFRIMQAEGVRRNQRVMALRDDLWAAMERAFERWLVEIFPAMRAHADLRGLSRTLRTLLVGAYAELVIIPREEREGLLRERAQEIGRTFVPTILEGATAAQQVSASPS